ncbi:ABC transporter substrate-binding protein [Tamlana sp. 2201CG12-4]|uniref:type IX secretion system anionic LPS delivery protein PorZ n=1 Tax=Tamlana sp. 2201CG12-4 TaxID=3112582 RepID=UPI002DB9D476|nr:ABC transporter substrate-binding protein [Tamlana sp. 2201CG12-4]MEC3906446.1 ABC transporter substrate-binding protein [Tamlana sp. 2201CG12-4]
MSKRIVIFILCLFPLLQFSQDFSAQWEGHFSYNNIKDVSQGNNKIFAAADNAIFSFDIQTNETKEITTVSGLSGETISTIHYSETYELLVVGYETGLIEIVFDNDTKVITVVDILDKPTIPPNNKMINHFNEFENVVYISTGFGISVFDLDRLEFGDTYFIGSGGSQIPVTQTTIFEGFIYASCFAGNGIKKADVLDPNLIDSRNWQTIGSGNWMSIEAQLDKLYATNTNRKIYSVVNDVTNEILTYTNTPLDLRSVNQNLIVTTQDEVFVYDVDFNVISQVGIDPLFETSYRVATVDQDNIYIGTKDFGVLKTPLNNPIVFEEIHPDGPLLNIPFSIQAEPNGLWVTFGEYNLFFNPYPLNSRGISHLKDDEWINNPYSEVLEAKCLNSIAVSPFNNTQVFLSSFFNGLLEVNEDIPTILYNETNSGLESLVLPDNPDYIDIRVGASAFDNNGLLWTITSRIDRPLKSYNPNNNQWESYSFTDIIPDGFSDELGFKDLVIGDDGTKWVAGYRNGLIGFNENRGNTLIKKIEEEDQNMPTDFATALAIDNRNQLWIGTFKGLRVLYNTSNFFTDDNIRVEEIIIEEDGIAKELLFQQNITDIEVDGSNNKWIGTSDSGLFYFSPDGQKTIFHFTKDNSPLPSDGIRDVSIDGTKGIVYIATEKGLVSFRSGSSSPIENLEKAFAYPNPVRPGFNMLEKKIKIKDISEHVNIKITDIEGNLVAEAQSRVNQRHNGYNLEIDGGTAYWNGRNLANNTVASGVYLVMLSDLDTFETKVIKLMVVR